MCEDLTDQPGGNRAPITQLWPKDLGGRSGVLGVLPALDTTFKLSKSAVDVLWVSDYSTLLKRKNPRLGCDLTEGGGTATRPGRDVSTVDSAQGRQKEQGQSVSTPADG